MKQKIFTLLLISVIGLVSCRKDKVYQDIKQYDESQIQNYIASSALTGMLKDPTAGDTSGIYYKIILPGVVVPPATTLVPLDYPDDVSFVYTVRTLDGKFIKADTIQNHVDDFLGHLTLDTLPPGVQLAIKNLVKYKGASARLLIPSHLGFGVTGYRTPGSSQNANAQIAGNESLDYYIHIIANYTIYDEEVIKNNVNLTGYQRVQSDTLPNNYYYYKILTKGTGLSPITDASTITTTYTGTLLNGAVFDGGNNGDNIATLSIFSLVPGVKEALEKFAVAGTKISIIIPSALGYGAGTAGTIPPNSVLRFTFEVITVTP
jgi:FKBP-type peptidyl-prolyl cis-trans isomerase FkpA